MCRFLHLRLVAAAIAVACVVGSASPAKAALQLYLQEAGGNASAITAVGLPGGDFTSASFTGTYGDFTVTLLGGSSDNGATLSDLLSSTVSVKNNDTANAHTLSLFVSQTNYNLPSGSPLRMESGQGGSTNSGTMGLTNIFQAWFDASNTLLGMPALGTNGTQNGNPSGSTWDTGSAVGVFARSGPYSLTSRATLALSAGGISNYSNHVNVTNAVPAPAGVVLIASVLPFVAVLRRRLRKSDAVTAA